MPGITRDFTVEQVEDLIAIVKDEVEESNQFFLFDWFEDTFLTQELNIRDCLDDIKSYHTSVIDKNNIGYDALSKILAKVKEVDLNYQTRFNSLLYRLDAFSTKISGYSALLSYGSLSLSPVAFKSTVTAIETNYVMAKEEAEATIDVMEMFMEEALYEAPAWWEQAANAVGGLGVSLVTNCVIEPALGLLGAAEWVLFGGSTRANDYWREQYYATVAELEEKYVTCPQWYYGGRVVGDKASVVIGAAAMVSGIQTMLGGFATILSGITIGGASTLAVATGVGATPGAVGLVISGTAVAVGAVAVAAGAIITAAGAVVVNAALKNYGDNFRKFQGTGSGLTNEISVPSSKALDLAEEFLGSNYKDLGNGRFMSADGTRIVRMGDSDILGAHGGGSHMNFETLTPNPYKPGKMMIIENIHVYLLD